MQKASIKVPATTANMGPGFDCLGMALDIWNTVEIEVGGSGIEITGQGSNDLPKNHSNLVYQRFSQIYNILGKSPPSALLRCHNEIPLDRGMGSSAAAVVAGLLLANTVSGSHFTSGQLLDIAAEIEGHPDNVAPAILGGCQIVVKDHDVLVTSHVPLPNDLKTVLFIPNTPMPTSEARSVLSSEISREDAVFNISRAALLVHALAVGDLKHLAIATDDKMHQPARQSVFYPMKNIFRAAMDAGALGVFLSGSGSTVLALTIDRAFTIGYEMADAAAKSGLGGEIKVSKPTPSGAYVLQQ